MSEPMKATVTENGLISVHGLTEREGGLFVLDSIDISGRRRFQIVGDILKERGWRLVSMDPEIQYDPITHRRRHITCTVERR